MNAVSITAVLALSILGISSSSPLEPQEQRPRTHDQVNTILDRKIPINDLSAWKNAQLLADIANRQMPSGKSEKKIQKNHPKSWDCTGIVNQWDKLAPWTKWIPMVITSTHIYIVCTNSLVLDIMTHTPPPRSGTYRLSLKNNHFIPMGRPMEILFPDYTDPLPKWSEVLPIPYRITKKRT